MPPLLYSLFLIAVVALVWIFRSQRRAGGDDIPAPPDRLSVSQVRRLPKAHSLDVFVLASCAKRFLVSVAFDRQIRLWNLGGAEPTSQLIMPTANSPINWPVSRVIIDNHAEWLAFCSPDGAVVLWNRSSQAFGRVLPPQLGGKLLACFFVRMPQQPLVQASRGSASSARLLLVLDTGMLVDVDVQGTETVTHRICDSAVHSPCISSMSKTAAPRLITVSNNGCIFMSSKRGSWSTTPLRIASMERTAAPSASLRFSVVSTLRSVAAVHDEDREELHVVDILSGALIHVFRVRPFHSCTLRTFHSRPQQCVSCGSTAVPSFTVAYTEKGADGSFVMTTITAPRGGGRKQSQAAPLCLRSERDARERRCSGFAAGVVSAYSMRDPGSWEATKANGVAGIRRAGSKTQSPQDGRERWEGWSMTAHGLTAFHELETDLPAEEPGLACAVGQNAVAVTLTNLIFLIQFGRQLHEDDADDGILSRRARGRLSRQNSRRGLALGGRRN